MGGMLRCIWLLVLLELENILCTARVCVKTYILLSHKSHNLDMMLTFRVHTLHSVLP